MKVKYKSSMLGYLWSIAHPLAYAAVFFIAFKVVMRIQMQDYTLFLISGLFPWQWFVNSVNVGPVVFLTNASIIKKVNFPRSVLVVANILQDGFHFLFSVPVFVLFLFIYGKSPTLAWLYGLPILFATQFFLLYGLCLALASVNLFMRDIERIVSILTTLLFYFTPIIYPVEMVPEVYRPILNANPVAPLMIEWRRLLLEGHLEPQGIFLSLAYGVFFYAVGTYVYRKLSWKFAEVL